MSYAAVSSAASRSQSSQSVLVSEAKRKPLRHRHGNARRDIRDCAATQAKAGSMM